MYDSLFKKFFITQQTLVFRPEITFYMLNINQVNQHFAHEQC